MKKFIITLLFVFTLLPGHQLFCRQGARRMVKQIENNIIAPVFIDRNYLITDYGAIGDGMTDAFPAISRAIDICSTKGCGRVVVPAGKFFSGGPVVLKSNVNLYVSEGAEILFSTNEKDYLPPVLTRWEGIEVFNFSPLVYAYNVKNIAITGKGTLNG